MTDQTTRTFPVLIGPRVEDRGKASIPWNVIDPHRRQAMENHGQTLERLAERGGLCWSELLAVLNDRRWHRVDEAEAERLVLHHISTWERLAHVNK